MFSLRNLAMAGVASIPILGLVFGCFIALSWLRAFMRLGNWRTLPLALLVALLYFVLQILVFAPVMAEFMAGKWLVAFLFTAWGLAQVNCRIDQAEGALAESAGQARKQQPLT